MSPLQQKPNFLVKLKEKDQKMSNIGEKKNTHFKSVSGRIPLSFSKR